MCYFVKPPMVQVLSSGSVKNIIKISIVPSYVSLCYRCRLGTLFIERPLVNQKSPNRRWIVSQASGIFKNIQWIVEVYAARSSSIHRLRKVHLLSNNKKRMVATQTTWI